MSWKFFTIKVDNFRKLSKKAVEIPSLGMFKTWLDNTEQRNLTQKFNVF